MADKNTIIGIEDRVNNVRYMGVAENVAALNDHKALLEKGTHPNAELQAAWSEHGADQFQLQHLGTMGHPDVALQVMQTMFDNIATNQSIGYTLSAKPLEGA